MCQRSFFCRISRTGEFFFQIFQKSVKKTHFSEKILSKCHELLLNISKFMHFSTAHTIEIFTQHNTTQSDNKKRTILEMENSSSILSLPNGEKLTVRHAHDLPKLHIRMYHHTIVVIAYQHVHQKVIFSVIFLFSPKIHCIHFIVQLHVNCSQSEARKGGVFGLCVGVCAGCCPVSKNSNKQFY